MKIGSQGRWGTFALVLAFSVGCGDDNSNDTALDAGKDGGSQTDDTDDGTTDPDDPTTDQTDPTEPTDSTPEPTATSTESDAGNDGETQTEDAGNPSPIIDSGAGPNTVSEAGTTFSDGGHDAGPTQDTLQWSESDEFVGDVAIEYATLSVPLDYEQPQGTTLDLALARLRTTSDERAGVLMFNPGGPGPGVTGDALATASIFRDAFPTMDIVFVDNRGTGNSAPIDCGTDELELEVTDSELQDEANLIAAFIDECGERHGDALRFFNVENVARDMDSVRAALGEEKLNFWGVSYGTFQGSIYAKLFPERVRAFVLDSPVVRAADGAPTWVDKMAESAAAYEGQLNRFFTWADQDEESPLHGIDGYELVDVDGGHMLAPVAPEDAGVIADADASVALADTDASTVDAGPIAAPLLAQQMYDDLNAQLQAGVELQGGTLPASILDQVTTTLLREGDWFSLAVVMWTAHEGAWEFMVDVWLQDQFSGVGAESRRVSHANLAINLLDSTCPADFDIDTATEIYEQLATDYPRLGAGFAIGVADCLSWNIEPNEPRQSADDVEAPPILVMGAVNDPATPYANAVALVEQLGNDSQLLTSMTEGHGVATASDCGATALLSFIADPDLSAVPTVCTPGELGAAAKLRSVVKPEHEQRRRR